MTGIEYQIADAVGRGPSPAADFAVAALYRFTPIADPGGVRDALAAVAERLGVRGTLLVAGEGLNGTIAGSDAGVAAVLAAIRGLPGCGDLVARRSRSAGMPFLRLKVRVKREIVTMGAPLAGPTGTLVQPRDWNALIAAPGTIVIDTRNAYEVAVGSFAGAIDPGTVRFSDFPVWFRERRAALLGASGGTEPRVAMFCTGGIRCEKATALLKAEGVGEVHHLAGGILAYLESVAPEDSRFEGECFVFDERVSVGHGLAPGSHVLCRGCRMPVGAAGRASPLYVEGVACPACHAARDAGQRAGYAERHRQVGLARARGVAHVGGGS